MPDDQNTQKISSHQPTPHRKCAKLDLKPPEPDQKPSKTRKTRPKLKLSPGKGQRKINQLFFRETKPERDQPTPDKSIPTHTVQVPQVNHEKVEHSCEQVCDQSSQAELGCVADNPLNSKRLILPNQHLLVEPDLAEKFQNSNKFYSYNGLESDFKQQINPD